MPEIDSALVPSISAGQLFERFTTDTTLNVRWVGPQEPVLFEVINRPMADITLRQLIIAKALDEVELSLSFLSLFPFLVPPYVNYGSGTSPLPQSWIWDMHTSIPAKWEYLRLARIERIKGVNNGGSGGEQITGILRLAFTAQLTGSATETSLFTADYQIDTSLTYQIVPIIAATSGSYDPEPNPIDPSEVDTIAGFLIFRTLDVTDSAVIQFYNYMAPPVNQTVNAQGYYVNPAIYNLVASTGGGSTPDDFLAGSLNHGTGILVVSAYNSIPALNADFATWLESANYPFRINTTGMPISQDGIQVPSAIFNEFNMTVPAADQPTGDSTNLFSPVWLSSITRVDTLATTLLFTFSTYTILDDNLTPQVVEFANLTLTHGGVNPMVSGQVVPIVPVANLLKADGSDQASFMQQFGAGHVVLGAIWNTTLIENFFQNFLALVNTNVTLYNQSTATLSSYALSRVPRYVPTKGEWDALRGSTSRLTTAVNPSDTNRYITEGDQGLGDKVDFRTISGIVQNPDIDDIGYNGSLAHRFVYMGVNANGSSHSYNTDILPRLRCLLGRDPQFGDCWFDGTIFKIFAPVMTNGVATGQGAWISI